MSELMPNRNIHVMFQIDTNRINSKQKLDNMNLLEKWREDGVITIDMPEPATKESFAGNNKQRIKKATQYIHSFTYADTSEERWVLKKIEDIIFPDGAKEQNQENDVEIVFNAHKYGRILVTNDGGSKKQPGGILGNAQELKKQLDIIVINDEVAVQLVREKIQKRDNFARAIASRENIDVPDWVGKD